MKRLIPKLWLVAIVIACSTALSSCNTAHRNQSRTVSPQSGSDQQANGSDRVTIAEPIVSQADETPVSVDQGSITPVANQNNLSNNFCDNLKEYFICKAEVEVVRLTNEYRSKKGIPPLTQNSVASDVARDWSQSQGESFFGMISHFGLSGRTKRIASALGTSFTATGENVAMFSNRKNSFEQIAETFATQWYNSPGHQKNMLSRNFSNIGMGIFKTKSGAYYGTQIFYTPRR